MIPADLERPVARRYPCPSPAGCEDDALEFGLLKPSDASFSVLVATARFGAG